MANKKLRGKGKYIYIEQDNIRKHLCNTIDNYNLTGLNRNEEGYVSTSNLCKDGQISWENLLYIKDQMDTLSRKIKKSVSNKSKEQATIAYKLRGGKIFHDWLTNKANHLRTVTDNQTQLTKDTPTVEHIVITRNQYNMLIESNTENIDRLYSYLNMTDEEKYIDITYEIPYLYNDFVEQYYHEYSEIFEKINNQGFEEDYEYLNYLRDNHKYIAQLYGQYAIESNDIVDTDKPTWMCLENPTKLSDVWLIHFTNYAYNIERDGFTHGTDDISSLCLTTHFTHDSKSYGGYNFAYTLRDAPRQSSHYGDEIVLFKVPAAVRALHYWDEEYQTIFWGENVTNITRLNADLYYESEDDESVYEEFDSIEEMANYYIKNVI